MSRSDDSSSSMSAGKVERNLLMTPAALKGNGRCSAVSIYDDVPAKNKEVVVAVRDVSFQRALYYNVGIYDRNTAVMEWGPHGGIKQYSTGQYPSVCLYYHKEKDKLYVIECHGRDFLKMCHYTVGIVKFNNRSIEWGKTMSIGNGLKPKVAVTDDGTVVVVYERMCTMESLGYLVGTLKPDKLTIDFAGEGKEIEVFKGVEPDIGIRGKTVYVMYRSSIGADIGLSWGTIKGSAVEWKEANKQRLNTTGKNPSFSINANGYAVEVHQVCYWKRLSSTCGRVVENNVIEWDDTKELDYGEYPSIALSDLGCVAKMHSAPVGLDLFYSHGTIYPLET